MNRTLHGRPDHARNAIARSARELRDCGWTPPPFFDSKAFDFVLVGGKTFVRYWPFRLEAQPGAHGQRFTIAVENGSATYEFSEIIGCWRLIDGCTGEQRLS